MFVKLNKKICSKLEHNKRMDKLLKLFKTKNVKLRNSIPKNLNENHHDPDEFLQNTVAYLKSINLKKENDLTVTRDKLVNIDTTIKIMLKNNETSESIQKLISHKCRDIISTIDTMRTSV